MADFIPTPQGVQAVLAARYFNRDISTVICFDYGSVPTGDDFDDLAEQIANAWADEVVPHLAGNYDFVSCTLRGLQSNEGREGIFSFPTPVTGGYNALNQEGSSAQALCFTLRTNTAGRSGRGRLFLPGLVRDALNVDYADAAWATLAHNGLNVFRTAATEGNTLQWAVLSKVHGKAPRAQGLLSVVRQVEMRNLRIDSQRRRAPRD